MSKKQKDELRAKIKQMESSKREPIVAKEEEGLIPFESWWHQRREAIPKHHAKEVISADFKARGLGNEATLEQFDKALSLYGIRLQ